MEVGVPVATRTTPPSTARNYLKRRSGAALGSVGHGSSLPRAELSVPPSLVILMICLAKRAQSLLNLYD
jgi:hypothetical protein